MVSESLGFGSGQLILQDNKENNMWELFYTYKCNYSELESPEGISYVEPLLVFLGFAVFGLIKIWPIIVEKRKNRSREIQVKELPYFIILIAGTCFFAVTLFNTIYPHQSEELIQYNEQLEQFFEKVENEEYDTVVEGEGILIFEHHRAYSYIIAIDGNEYNIDNNNDRTRLYFPEKALYKLYIIHADQWNADKVVRIDIWREKE